MFRNIPEFGAGVLSTAKRIDFFVFYNEETIYEDCIVKCIGDKECNVYYMSYSGLFF